MEEKVVVEVNGISFISAKQSNGEKGICVGCAFDMPETVEILGKGCVDHGTNCVANKNGNMVVYKFREVAKN